MAKEATYYGTGRRKSSVARVFITPGTGNMTINGRTLDDYFGLETLKGLSFSPAQPVSMTTRSLSRAAAQPARQAQSVTAFPVHSSRQTQSFVPSSRRPAILPVTLV